MTSKNEPAYPILHGNPGLTKLELFAAMAMQGFAADTENDLYSPSALARAACDYAEALINELEKRK